VIPNWLEREQLRFLDYGTYITMAILTFTIVAKSVCNDNQVGGATSKCLARRVWYLSLSMLASEASTRHLDASACDHRTCHVLKHNQLRPLRVVLIMG